MELIASNMIPLLWGIPDIGTSDQVSHNEVELQGIRDSDIGVHIEVAWSLRAWAPAPLSFMKTNS
jgi:hypothetical protein